jgi:hypothetical protein
MRASTYSAPAIRYGMGRDDLRAAARNEAAALVRLVAEPSRPRDTVRLRIARAALRLNWSYGRTEDIWRGEAHRIEAFEIDQLRKWKPAP